jgi:MFS family permease
VREHTGSFTSAGFVAAAEAAGAGAATPVQGRLIDRLGQPRVLIACGVGNATGLALLAAVAVAGAPMGVLLACAFLAGACIPPLGACMRALWPVLLGDDATLDAAYSFEAILTEVLFIGGPFLATILFALASPAAALLVAAALALAGTLIFARSRAAREWRGREAVHAGGWALSSDAVRTLVATNAAIGVAFGAVEVAMAAFARADGSASAAGIPLAAMAAGSMAGGVWYGTRSWRGPVGSRLLVALAVLAVTLAPLLAAGSIPVMVALSVIAGVPIAPAAACLYRLIEDAAPAGMLAEAFTWLSTATVAGAALGSAVAGPLIEGAGVRAGLAVPCAAAVLAAAIAFAGRATLAPRAAMVPGA